jgi:DNA-binding transcriptional LysR family regulator
VQVELLMNDRNLDLIDDRLDLAVRFGELPDSSQVAFALGAVRPVFCASPRYLARVGIPAHPQDLEHHVCTRFTGFARLREWTFHKGEEVLKVPVAGAFRCNLEQNLLDACVDGFGIGRFLSYVVAPMVASRRLKLVLEDYAPPPWPVNLLAPRTQLLPARTRLMLEWLRKKLSRRLAACRI